MNTALSRMAEPAHGTWTINCHTYVVTWSKGMYRIHGIDPDSCMPDIALMRRLYPQLGQTLFAWAMGPTFVEEQHFSYETEVHRPDGTKSLILMNATTHHQDGYLELVSGVVYDLFAMESQRVVSIETEQQYQMLFRDAPNGLLQAAPDKRILLVNPAFCKLLGYSSEELLGMTTEDITHPDDHQIASEAVRRLWEREVDHYSYEKRYIRKDGSAIWTHLGLSLFRGLDGKPLNFIGQCQDISERKAKEDSLHQELASQAVKRAVLESQNEHLRDLTNKDPLTQLGNRTAFEKALQQISESSARRCSFAVISIEIGSLALRNRNHGEKAVDDLLRSVGTALRRACNSGACIARLSGGNFRILLQPCKKLSLEATLGNIKSELATVSWRNGPLSPKLSSSLFEQEAAETSLDLMASTLALPYDPLIDMTHPEQLRVTSLGSAASA